jgi:hypothetical protein
MGELGVFETWFPAIEFYFGLAVMEIPCVVLSSLEFYFGLAVMDCSFKSRVLLWTGCYGNPITEKKKKKLLKAPINLTR